MDLKEYANLVLSSVICALTPLTFVMLVKESTNYSETLAFQTVATAITLVSLTTAKFITAVSA